MDRKLIRKDETIYRVLAEKNGRLLVIDCLKRNMPKWTDSTFVEGKFCTEADLGGLIGMAPSEEDLTQEEIAVARSRYSLIAGILVFLSDDEKRNAAINHIVKENGVSRRTLTTYLCDYLVYDSITVLARKRRHTKEKELTPDQKNIRWALNKFYYTRHGNSLPDTYVMMLKEKYTDAEGGLISGYPTISQFRYFYKKHNKKQTEIISREGLKEYQLNHRPLLGDGVQEMAQAVGWGMLDGTICDIYLVDDSGNLIGRPVLLACVDAYSGICMGYMLMWEGGVYSVRELLLNTITDKLSWCRKFGIGISKEQWPCSELPGIFVTDRGSEFISYNFEQVTELGCKAISLPSFSANLKGPVEKLFDLIQDSYKPYLKGKGVIEPDYQKRGARDYREQACLTMEQFEKIVIHCIIYHNSQRVLENFPYTEEMVDMQVSPYCNAIWEYGKGLPGANLIQVNAEQLVLTLLPRTEGKFTRKGLVVNKMRYHCDGYTERYLKGGTAVVAYNPDDVGSVYLVDEGYQEFDLIERRFADMQLDRAGQLQEAQKEIMRGYAEEQLQAKISLASRIESIAGQRRRPEEVDIKSVRKTRQKERDNRHRDLVKEVCDNE